MQGNKLSNFEWGADCIIQGNLDLGDNSFETLKGISKHVAVVARNINISGNPLKGGVLGLMMLEFGNLSYGNSWGERGHKLTGDAEKAIDIVEKHRLHKTVNMDRVIDCQHELIESGLEKFAEA